MMEQWLALLLYSRKVQGPNLPANSKCNVQHNIKFKMSVTTATLQEKIEHVVSRDWSTDSFSINFYKKIK